MKLNNTTLTPCEIHESFDVQELVSSLAEMIKAINEAIRWCLVSGVRWSPPPATPTPAIVAKIISVHPSIRVGVSVPSPLPSVHYLLSRIRQNIPKNMTLPPQKGWLCVGGNHSKK